MQLTINLVHCRDYCFLVPMLWKAYVQSNSTYVYTYFANRSNSSSMWTVSNMLILVRLSMDILLVMIVILELYGI